jgi:hypothetical protein
MKEDDEELVVPGREGDGEVGGPGPFRDRPAVQKNGPGAHGPQLQASAGRRALQPEPRHEGDFRGHRQARLLGETDPPGARKRVGQPRPDGLNQSRGDKESDGEREKAGGWPPDGH